MKQEGTISTPRELEQEIRDLEAGIALLETDGLDPDPWAEGRLFEAKRLRILAHEIYRSLEAAVEDKLLTLESPKGVTKSQLEFYFGERLGLGVALDVLQARYKRMGG